MTVFANKNGPGYHYCVAGSGTARTYPKQAYGTVAEAQRAALEAAEGHFEGEAHPSFDLSVLSRPGLFVYLAYCRQAGLLKIGFSRDPLRRSTEFRMSRRDPTFGMKSVLLHAFPSRDARSVEAALHAAFAPKRVKGEWFRLRVSDALRVAAIKGADTPADLPTWAGGAAATKPAAARRRVV